MRRSTARQLGRNGGFRERDRQRHRQRRSSCVRQKSGRSRDRNRGLLMPTVTPLWGLPASERRACSRARKRDIFDICFLVRLSRCSRQSNCRRVESIHSRLFRTSIAGCDFRVVFMNSAVNNPNQPLAVLEWGYLWDNNSYARTAAAGAPVQLCASPLRNGAGAGMVSGYGPGTGNFGGFSYAPFID
jgi:hypothetical protein